jgi:hypothetical protein
MHSPNYPGIYRGQVVDTNDPLNLSRIRMLVPQVLGEEVTDWAWPVLGGVSQHKPVYGEWQSDYTQSIASTTVAYPVTYGTNDGSYGITLANSSQITFEHAGIYNIQFSAQLENTATAEHDVTIWLRKNGVNVEGSSGFVGVPGTHGGINGHTIAAWNYVLEFNAGDYFELVWQADSTAVTMQYYAPGTSPDTPSAAGIILTVSSIGKVTPVPTAGVWAAFEGGDPNFPLWIGTF